MLDEASLIARLSGPERKRVLQGRERTNEPALPPHRHPSRGEQVRYDEPAVARARNPPATTKTRNAKWTATVRSVSTR